LHFLIPLNRELQEIIMKKSMLFVFVIVCFTGFGTPAFAHEAHEHGTARVNLSVEGQKVEIELETPLAGLISFEHAPETAAQKEEVRGMAKTLHNAGALFLFPADAKCRLEKVSLASEAISDDLLSPTGAPAVTGAKEGEKKEVSHEDKKDGEKDHADLDAEISFICRNPEKLNRIEVGMFKAFPNLEKIEVRMVTPKGQGAAELAPQSNVVKW
jgi:hypothetical protein